MASEQLTDTEIARLSAYWTDQLDKEVARSSDTAEELRTEAGKLRSLAAVSEFQGQRRAFVSAAERYEREADERSAVRP